MNFEKDRTLKTFTSEQVHQASLEVLDALDTKYPDLLSRLVALDSMVSLGLKLGLGCPDDFYVDTKEPNEKGSNV